MKIQRRRVTLWRMRAIGLFALLSALLTGFAAAQETTKALKLKLLSLTGSIEVESGGKKTVFNGTDLPPDFTIALGSRVRILSGQAVFSDGKIALSAPTGADFTLSEHPRRERESPASFELTLAKNSTKMELAFEGKTAMLAPDSAMLIGSAPGGKAEVSPLRGELHIPGTPALPGTNEAAKPPDGEAPLMPMPDWRPPPSSPWQDLLAPKAPGCNLTCAACWTLDTAACQCLPPPPRLDTVNPVIFELSSSCQYIVIPVCALPEWWECGPPIISPSSP